MVYHIIVYGVNYRLQVGWSRMYFRK